MIKRTLLTALLCSAAVTTAGAEAQAVRFIGDVIPTGYTFCPVGTIPAQGQLLPISSYSAAYSLIGNVYGGDGMTTFAVPDLRGRVPIHHGAAPGGPNYVVGTMVGAEASVLSVANLPAHTHMAGASAQPPSVVSPENASFPTPPPQFPAYASDPNPTVAMDSDTIGSTGGSQPFSLVGPSSVLTYCVALEGIFPSRG
ncbi:MAG: phage tail protein [Oceanicaulis sp.]